jgi:hypothetical protein
MTAVKSASAMVSLSADFGSEKADEVFGSLHARLDRLFSSRLRKHYSRKVKGLVIVLLVSGRVCNFRLEGPRRVSYSKKYGQLIIELGIPLKAWEHKSRSEIKQYLVDGLRAAFATLKGRLAAMDENSKIDELDADFEGCLGQFLK